MILPSFQVTKVIQKLANTASVREAAMKPLEPFVKAYNDQLKVGHKLKLYLCIS